MSDSDADCCGALLEASMDKGLFLALERQCRQMSLVSHGTITIDEMDRASKALAQAPPNDTRTWAARSDTSGVPLTTLYNRARGRPSKEETAQRQQYLTVEEEKALVAFLLLMSSFGQPVRIKYIPTLAFSIARRRSPANMPRKPPGKNWARTFEKRHPQLKARRVRSIDWKRHEIQSPPPVRLVQSVHLRASNMPKLPK